ncbi:hypothetical protein B0H14DRAFT_3152335 [Mycena olivaceomarginata]|nr:hypothetical protein B0H14DRAFT_3152335 [Mycena olivaceomarginata]
MPNIMASKSTPSTDGPVTLHFHDITRVAGETITGRVDLNVTLAQEDKLEHLRIKFKGIVHGHLTTMNADMSTSDHHQTVTVENLPPSFHCEVFHRTATISYALEVVGERTRFYRTNRRIRRIISVVPAASQGQLLARETLRQGWNGPWSNFTGEEKLRQGIWGNYSRACVKLTIADMASYPITTAIPFSFHIETVTKLMHRSDAPTDKHGRPLFPALPALSSDVRLAIRRTTEIRVRTHMRQVEEDFHLKGSLGDVTRVAAVHQVLDEPEWTLPSPGPKDKKGRGICRRAVHFHSAIAIPYAPTSNTELLDWQYNLLLEVTFPGIGNNLRLLVPLHLHPGSACPPPPPGASGSSSITYADILPAGPPPMVDLPPSYWTGEHHAWDVDKKS